jgi:hypothetical protein
VARHRDPRQDRIVIFAGRDSASRVVTVPINLPYDVAAGPAVPIVCYRTGRKLGRTVYAQLGREPADSDPFLGLMETPELAGLVVALLNGDDR